MSEEVQVTSKKFLINFCGTFPTEKLHSMWQIQVRRADGSWMTVCRTTTLTQAQTRQSEARFQMCLAVRILDPESRPFSDWVSGVADPCPQYAKG